MPHLRTTFVPVADGAWAPPPSGVDRLALVEQLQDRDGNSIAILVVCQQHAADLVAFCAPVETDLGPVLVPAVGGVPGLVQTLADRLVSDAEAARARPQG